MWFALWLSACFKDQRAVSPFVMWPEMHRSASKPILTWLTALLLLLFKSARGRGSEFGLRGRRWHHDKVRYKSWKMFTGQRETSSTRPWHNYYNCVRHKSWKVFTGQCEAQAKQDIHIAIDAWGTNHGIIMFTIKTAITKSNTRPWHKYYIRHKSWKMFTGQCEAQVIEDLSVYI